MYRTTTHRVLVRPVAMTGIIVLGLFVCTVPCEAQMIKLQPDETTSKDVFTYEFARPGLFGISTSPRTTNLDTATLASDHPDSPLGILLATSQSDLATSSDPNTAHAASTWIGFDLGSISATGQDLVSAELYLYVVDGEAIVGSILGQPAFGNPSEQSPLPTTVYTPDGAWDEQGITWENQPGEGMSLDTVNVSGVDQWVSWDVTEAVRGWLNGEPNHGLFLEQEEVVPSTTAMTNVAAALYASSAFEDPNVRPYLAVTLVPEPTAIVLVLLGAASIASTVRRTNCVDARTRS